ncbi:hypothetical protein FD754_018600, partial [Muntiacus muntjak]
FLPRSFCLYTTLIAMTGWKSFFHWLLVALMLFLVTVVVTDSYYYRKLVTAPLNIVLYNVFTLHGPDLYGTESWYFYLINEFLNFNFVPMYISFILFSIQPHKEERVLFPVYPFICLCGAVAFSALLKCYHFVVQQYRLDVPEGQPVNVCIGKKWYRFPNSFLLPNNWQLQFIPSEFRGQLPKPSAEGTLEPNYSSNRKEWINLAYRPFLDAS